jgi:putative transposase
LFRQTDEKDIGMRAPSQEVPIPGLAIRLTRSTGLRPTMECMTSHLSLEATARWLKRINADAASSLREGLEETLAVVCLGLAGALRRTLATTNPIEPALSVTRRVTARVTRWRDGEMRSRWWCVAGLLRADSKFRRVKGHRALPTLIKALEESTRARPSGIAHGDV